MCEYNAVRFLKTACSRLSETSYMLAVLGFVTWAFVTYAFASQLLVSMELSDANISKNINSQFAAGRSDNGSTT